MFELSSLPYQSLEPHISDKLLDRHYNGHHKAYVDALNRLVVGTEFEGMGNGDLEKIITKAHGSSNTRAIFNNAAQVWNHDFYWKSMKRGGGGNPPERLAKMLSDNFGGVKEFMDAFAASGVGHFGSGWTWLLYDKNSGSLKIVSTPNADSPLLTPGHHPVLAMDVWEHAYYLDYLNVRKKYVDVFLEHLIDWDFALKGLEAAGV
ncbi:superoxide dismutase [Anaplasma capra]|uniref:superoxide dismutase n=1 Tax=Anaplasma capra TaxID=1562740 RepID=UPI0021D5CA5B|nr:superoxide dismutase [Anaplasma capra]MCU7611540.1 superoxide dismutase [Anaplasma capra]MCU7612021.1 superoxide dismutase [Anaplasma capra]